MRLILGSSSQRRLQLLAQLGLTPDLIVAPEINEIPLKKELPRIYVERVAHEKTAKLINSYPEDIILCADTVASCGPRILPKPSNKSEVETCLKLLSGRRHRVYTTVCIKHPAKTIVTKTVVSILKLKRLSTQELKAYVFSEEGIGKAGGFSLQGKGAAFVIWLSGSSSNIIGLPLYETALLLQTVGVKIF